MIIRGVPEESPRVDGGRVEGLDCPSVSLVQSVVELGLVGAGEYQLRGGEGRGRHKQ